MWLKIFFPPLGPMDFPRSPRGGPGSPRGPQASDPPRGAHGPMGPQGPMGHHGPRSPRAWVPKGQWVLWASERLSKSKFWPVRKLEDTLWCLWGTFRVHRSTLWFIGVAHETRHRGRAPTEILTGCKWVLRHNLKRLKIDAKIHSSLNCPWNA